MPAHRLTNRHEDWDERGHIAAHDVVAVRLYLLTLLRLRSSARARGRRLSEARRRRMSKQIEDVLAALLRHHMSFDMATRPRQEFDRAPMKEPWQELDESVFVKMTRFYKKEFVRICDATDRQQGYYSTSSHSLAHMLHTSVSRVRLPQVRQCRYTSAAAAPRWYE
jgi:hypothetical protein